MYSSQVSCEDICDKICNSQLSSRSVNDLLVLLSTKTQSFDNVSECSAVSVISHPFSDEVQPNDKFSTRDCNLSFSSFYKETLEEIKKEFKESDSVCSCLLYTSRCV